MSVGTILSGEDAVNLWLQGSEAWNEWVGENPVGDVDFSDVDFSIYLNEDEPVAFDDLDFPKGEILFEYSSFSSGNVLKFDRCRFKENELKFNHIKFSDNLVHFVNVEFNQTKIWCHDTTFSDNSFDIIHSNLRDVSLIFTRTSFENSDFLFLGNKLDYFYFYASKTDFDGKFDVNAEVGSSTYFDFKGCRFSRNVSFDELNSSENLYKLSFRSCTFERYLALPKNEMKFIPDLIDTKISNQFSVHNIKCHLSVKKKKIFKIFSVLYASEEEDSARLRRLKEIAEDNKDHTQALRFMAMEMRAKRWHPELMSNAASLMDLAFDKLSSYGRSIKKPIILWLAQLIIFFGVFLSLSEKLDWRSFASIDLNVENAAEYSLANTFSFFSQSKSTRDQVETVLFGGDPNIWVSLLSYTQTGLSLLFLFLLGLALRNHFRLR
ncbi:hypothetical protein [Curvivirga sp.]|uniref:hypothetical protein n=1 Tax=Curvivirga sp. TaxID=2856848 RepID=UPI003B5BA918